MIYAEQVKALQQSARKAQEEGGHKFPRTEPWGAKHFQYKGDPPSVSCTACKRQVMAIGQSIVGTALESSC